MGWEQSGGELAPAVAGVVYRLWARRSAGAWPGRTVESVSWGGCEGRVPGRHVRGSDGTGGTRSGWTPSIRHLFRISTPGRRGMLLGGALRGRSPRTREGRIGPTAHNCSGQWLVVSGQRRGSTYFRVSRGLNMAPVLPEVRESSLPLEDEPSIPTGFDRRFWFVLE